jgi:hypothetical protein
MNSFFKTQFISPLYSRYSLKQCLAEAVLAVVCFYDSLLNYIALIIYLIFHSFQLIFFFPNLT